MDYFVWKDSFNIGIEEIDRQHRTFLEYLNDCYVLVSGGRHADIDTAVFDRLKAYAATHFRYEEDMMRLMEHPELEQQKLQHKYFESQIEELETALSAGNEMRPDSILVFLRDWFLTHILEQDKKFTVGL